MRLDLDAMCAQIARNCPRRADIDAIRATLDLRAPVGADFFLVLEIFRLLEFAGRHLTEVAHCPGESHGIVAWREIALRRLRYVEEGAIVEIQHEVEALAARAVGPLEINRLYRTARFRALPMILALVEVD